MAIDRSRYYHGPTKAVVGQETPGYAYASIFLKKRDEAWQMAQKQAAAEIAQGDTRYKLLMDAYQKRAADLDERMKALDKSLSDVAGDNAKALNAAVIQQSKNALTDAKQKADWEIAKKETMAVSQPSEGGSKSRSEGSSSGSPTDEYRKGLGSVSDEADEFIGTQKALVGDDPVALARGVESAPEGAGFVSVSDPKSARDLRYRTVSTSVDAAAAKVLKENPDLDPEDAIAVAESEVLGRLKTEGMGDYASAYSAVKATTTPTGGAGTSSSRVSESTSWRSGGGAVQKLRNPGLSDTAPVGMAAKIEPVPVDAAALTEARKELQAEIDKLKPPEMSQADWITRSREIMAGRFGPVQEAPSFYQRNLVQGLQSNLDNPVVQEAFKAWKARRPAPEAGSPEAPVRIKGPENYSSAAMQPPSPEEIAAAEKAVAAVPAQPEATPLVAAPGGAGGALAPAERVLVVEQARRLAADGRASELRALYPEGLPPELQASIASLRAPAPEMTFVPPVSTMAPPEQKAEPVPAPVAPPREGMEPAPLGAKPQPTEEFAPTPKSAPEKTEASPVRVPSKVTYYQNRVEEAVKLTGQPDKLARLSASGAGKVARDIYRANSTAGQPFSATYEELTLTFQGDEAALKAAHAVALALDMKARKSTEPPKE